MRNQVQAWCVLVAGMLPRSARSMVDHTAFTPLPCNDDFTMDCTPLDITDVSLFSAYVIPCGTCQVLSESVNFAGGLNVEGYLKILPPIDAASELSITTPFVFVQGKFTVDMESEESLLEERKGSIHIELVEGDGADIHMIPHPHNSMACMGTMGCNVGKRPFVVAGGAMDIRAYSQTCPSWTNLVDVVRDAGMTELGPVEYEQAPQPLADCPATVVREDFEGDTNVFDAIPSNAEYQVKSTTTTTGSTNHYFEVSPGVPRVHLTNPTCISPGEQYLFSVRVMLSGESASLCSRYGGNYCPRLILYTSSTRWRRIGVFQGKGLEDGTWGTFQLPVTFTAGEVGPSSNNGETYLFIEGPNSSTDISIDDFLLELAPPSTYPDPDQVCVQLIPNGDAESSSGGNTFPLFLSGGRAGVVTDETTGNSFFRHSGRYAWYNRLQTTINTGCVVEDVVYTISAKVWVHSDVPRQAEIVAGASQPDGTTNWSTLLLCPESTESSGFVTCEMQLSFTPQHIAATAITLFIRPRGDADSTVDWDDLSIEMTGFEEPDVVGLLVDPALVRDCWSDRISEGAEVLLTSHTLDFNDQQVVVASGMNATDGTISLASPFNNPMSGPGDFTVEVALLSRRITLQASSDSGSSIGGHFIVLHTPEVNQTIRGLEIKGFGQQGNLGRYVSDALSSLLHIDMIYITHSLTHLASTCYFNVSYLQSLHFHMSDNVHGSVVSKNIIRDSHQRCVVVHGSNGLLIEDNVAYK